MRSYFKILAAVIISVFLSSCGEDVVNNYYGGEAGAFNVNILESEYEIITAHKSYFDPNYVSNGYDGDYQYGMKITIKLDDPSKQGNINRIVMSYANYGYSFNKQELQEAYADSIGGYVFDFIKLDQIGNYSSMIWSVKLYDAKNNSSNEYPLITKFRTLSSINGTNDWKSKDDLEIALSTNYTPPAAGAKAETHFLNTAYEEIGVYKSEVSNYKWTVAGVPAGAVYYYYILTDKSLDVSRKFISGRYTIKNRLADNVEFISEVDSPVKIEYLKDLDKVLTLSASASELILLNYDDNSMVWKRKLASTPSTFAYSQARGTIYLGYANGDVDSINPADGSGKQLFTCSISVKFLLPAENYLLAFLQYSSTYSIYNLNNKQVASSSGSSFNYFYGALYVPETKTVYVREDDDLYAYSFNTATGTMSNFANVYFSYSNEVFRTFALSSDRTKIYLGEKYVYNAPSSNNYFSQSTSITPFCDMTVISNSYFATVIPSVSDGNTVYQAAVSLYNSSSVLLGKVSGIAGTPKKIFYKSNNLKVYSLQGSGRLITQKYTLEEIINNGAGKINTKRRIYTAKKL